VVDVKQALLLRILVDAFVLSCPSFRKRKLDLLLDTIRKRFLT
jgi:hypothetical protein